MLACCCGRDSTVKHMKDLGQNMMDLKIYQENLGDEIVSGRLDNAEWLLTGMDSILQILNEEFEEHRKLSRPFAYFYRRELSAPIDGIREAIEEKDTISARKHYRLLVKNCNGCHADHEIDKEVRF